ncbi:MULTISPECIES: ABC transporter permease [unclassified Streptomyces]|uniref:ABC transporter permease n=1 Tax=unclassified Streptomyces TaxID=2593676 RepID=UPI002E2D84FF|nr:ABC transporter permease [Streptomyces sp. NBC_00441]
MTIARFAVRRLLAACALFLAVSFLLFAGSEVLPGDAAAAALGPNTTPEQIAALHSEWGLDQPWAMRWAKWLLAAVQGDLGTSMFSRQPVTELVSQPFMETSLLVLLAAAIAVPLALVLGTLSGLRPGSRTDRVLSGTSVTLVSIPQFVTASLLALVFSSLLGLLPSVVMPPIGGRVWDRPEDLVLPVAALSVFAIAWAARLVRSTVMDADSLPSVEAARLAGLPEGVVLRRHLLPAVVPPCAHAFAWLVSGLFGGTAVVEQVFSYPGLSGVLVGAVRHHDTPVLEGVGLLLGGVIILALATADVIALLATPRLRTAAV